MLICDSLEAMDSLVLFLLMCLNVAFYFLVENTVGYFLMTNSVSWNI